ncbi:glycosyl transferase, group 1 [Roseibium sp. TrichSKD4]|uniref:class I SAM-dependent methyltransferase n=1 Tax=Roseibium sp. TrichSKD4 TaxID=744980 RepID=UPI0001E562DF|nr:class I SAM-dependent methyltransferase [Roseibium sp. TrichSKD4]EFO33025.1 glycosyl transferase, group 1 [Roseibium sp. TrichSKD4]
MTTFGADWLGLRHPYDLEARSQEIESRFLEALPRASVRILDLASGTGATVRALSEKLRRSGRVHQHWILSDFDSGLLEKAEALQGQGEGVTIETRQVNLAEDCASLPFQSVDGVTASAFFDLVSSDFVEELVSGLASHRLPLLAGLNYDGRTAWTPEHPADEAVISCFNHHQRGDKGFGPALGPTTTECLTNVLKSSGYTVSTDQSDWVIGNGHGDMQKALLSGWIQVAEEMAMDPAELAAWRKERTAQLASDNQSMMVGHMDLCARMGAV